MRLIASLRSGLILACMLSPVASGQAISPGQGDPVEMTAPPPSPMSPPGTPVPPRLPRDPEDLRREIYAMPAKHALFVVYDALPERSRPQRIVLLVRYGADGVLSDVRIEGGSGNVGLDAAALAWARRVRLIPSDEPGEGKLPIDFTVRPPPLPPRARPAADPAGSAR